MKMVLSQPSDDNAAGSLGGRHVFVTSRRLAEAFVAMRRAISAVRKREICIAQGVACANA